MFRRHSFFLRAFLALLILGGFALTGMMAYRAGAAHGYIAAATAIDADTETLPQAPVRLFSPTVIAQHTAAFPHFPSLGTLCCGGVLFLMIATMLFRPSFWHHPPMMGPRHPRWHRHCHPWFDYAERPAEEGAKTEEKADEAPTR